MSKLHFTVRSIDALSSGPSPQEFWDTSLTGLGLRISVKGVIAWTLLYRFQGKRRRFGLGRYPHVSLADARTKARDALAQVHNGVDPAATKAANRKGRTFDELAKDYLKNYAKPKKRTADEDEAILNKHFLPLWRDWKLSDLTRRIVRDALDPISKKGKGIMANRGLSLLRTMFRYGVEHDWCDANPCLGIRKLAKENRRDRVLTEGEIRTLWLAMNAPTFAHVALIFRLQLLTGQRVGEISSMSWSDVDLDSASWTIPVERSKNKRANHVPLSEAAQVILTTLGPTAGWVFPAPRTEDQFIQPATVHKAVERLRKATGITFRTHDFRRTVATYMAESGVPPHILGSILNHSPSGVTGRHYIWTTYESQKRVALEAWARRLNDIVTAQPPKTNVLPMLAVRK